MKDVFDLRQSEKLATRVVAPDNPTAPIVFSIQTRRFGSRNGRGRMSRALTTLKIAVLAPMPSASVSTATAVKPGFFNNWRKANLRSFMFTIDERAKHQTPNTKHQRTSKLQIPNDSAIPPY